MSCRTTRYTLGKSDKQSNVHVTHGSKQQSHGDTDDKAQPPLRITVPAINHRSPKYAALQHSVVLSREVQPSMLPNSRTNYRPLQNKSRRREIYSKRLSELPLFPSVSHPFPYISLLASELYRRKSDRDPRKTFQVRKDNTSWSTKCQH